MKLRLSVILVVLSAAASVDAGPAVPLVEGPDVPPSGEPDAVVRVFDGERFDGCAGKASATRTIAVPAGTWDRVILEFTAAPDGDPWDRLFGISIGGVEVVRGTTPRTSFTIRRDITEYASLLPPGASADVTLRLGTYVGEQVGTLDLAFYADEPTRALVRPPRARVLPVVDHATLTGHQTRLSNTVEFGDEPPASATIELTLSNHGAEEAQFHNRRFLVYVDGKEVAAARAMPYTYAILGFGAANANQACTGKATSSFGDTVHPVMWWTAQQALDVAGVHLGVGEIPPYRAEVDAADLPLLTGARTVEVVQFGGGAYWVTSLSVLIDE